MPKVTFQFAGNQITVDAKDGDTILKIALDHDITMGHACDGEGRCTTCMCKVLKGAKNLTPRSGREKFMGVTQDHFRLSCQARVQGDAKILIWPEGWPHKAIKPFK